MKRKRIMAALLSAALLCSGGTATVLAADTPTKTPAAQVVPAGSVEGETANPLTNPAPAYTGSNAVVEEVNLSEEGHSWILIKTEGETGQEIRLNLDEKTVFLDTQKGTPVSLSEVKKGDKVFAYYSTAMTRSIPPQAYAYAVVVNLEENKAPAHLLTAEYVTKGVDGSITLLGDNGSVLVTVTKDTPISALKTKNIIKNTDIHMGTTVFAWYDIVAMSMPGQATATKVVVLPTEDRDLTIITGGDMAIGEGKVENGIPMVPIRLVAEKLGFTVGWDGKTETVLLSNGVSKTSIKLGTDSYYKAADNGTLGMTAPTSFGAVAYEVNGVSWAPAEVFNLLMGETVVTMYGDTIHL